MSTTKLSTIGEAFCAAPLPLTVAADLCAADASYPHPRYGTNLLSVAEAQQMLGPIVLALVEDAWRSGHATAEEVLGAHGSDRLLDAIEAGWAEYAADNALPTTSS